MDGLTWTVVIGASVLVLSLGLQALALGVIPQDRRPSSGMAWLILILAVPLVGGLAFLFLGRTSVGRTRQERQAEALAVLRRQVDALSPPDLPAGLPPYLPSALMLNRNLGALPAVPAGDVQMFSDYGASLAAMAEAIAASRERVHIEFYIMAWDDTTAPVFEALMAAHTRGVKVRLLCDHIGSRGLDGWSQFAARLDASGIEWRAMLPFRPLKGEVRRPDLRNHRKILAIDGEVAFAGSQNMVEAEYHSEKNRAAGRRWVELTARVTGPLASSLDAVFAMDWYTETGELLEGRAPTHRPEVSQSVGQVVPSGPGVVAENNLRLFTTLIYGATRRISITSPYFVPDEALLYAVTTAAQRGVAVELFVSEEGDQFMVHHAQCSYYRALLDAGVRIWLYEAPKVLHSKHFSIDDDVVVLGSSNLDMRSFALNYEVSLLLTGADPVAQMRRVEDAYRARSRELTAEEWARRPRRSRYVDNVMRLTAAVQ